MSDPTQRASQPLIRQASGMLRIDTNGPGLMEVTGDIVSWLKSQHAEEGVLTVFIRHTSASLTIQENADPDVQADLVDALDRLAPETAPYRHSSEGPDDMPAHVKAALTSTSLSIPVLDGAVRLGTWQGIYLWEHRARPHNRSVALHFMGTALD